MKKLYPSFAPPEKWRGEKQAKWLNSEEWKRIRQKILARDDFTCAYCGYRSDKYQIIDHIDGNPENHSDSNLQVVCQMCNLVKHSGYGCAVLGIVDLYKSSRYPQNEIIRITREMRDNRADDEEIIRFLSLKQQVPFRQERNYLRNSYAFITSKRGNKSDAYGAWLVYHGKTRSKPIADAPQTRLTDWQD